MFSYRFAADPRLVLWTPRLELSYFPFFLIGSYFIKFDYILTCEDYLYFEGVVL
jgi:hypothetical protein